MESKTEPGAKGKGAARRCFGHGGADGWACGESCKGWENRKAPPQGAPAPAASAAPPAGSTLPRPGAGVCCDCRGPLDASAGFRCLACQRKLLPQQAERMAGLPGVWLTLKARILSDPRTYEHAGVSGLVAHVIEQASGLHDQLVRRDCERADGVADELAGRHHRDWVGLHHRSVYGLTPRESALVRGALCDAQALGMRHLHELNEAALGVAAGGGE